MCHKLRVNLVYHDIKSNLTQLSPLFTLQFLLHGHWQFSLLNLNTLRNTNDLTSVMKVCHSLISHSCVLSKFYLRFPLYQRQQQQVVQILHLFPFQNDTTLSETDHFLAGQFYKYFDLIWECQESSPIHFVLIIRPFCWFKLALIFGINFTII